jgi:hypothetical protein
MCAFGDGEGLLRSQPSGGSAVKTYSGVRNLWSPDSGAGVAQMKIACRIGDAGKTDVAIGLDYSPAGAGAKIERKKPRISMRGSVFE